MSNGGLDLDQTIPNVNTANPVEALGGLTGPRTAAPPDSTGKISGGNLALAALGGAMASFGGNQFVPLAIMQGLQQRQTEAGRKKEREDEQAFKRAQLTLDFLKTVGPENIPPEKQQALFDKIGMGDAAPLLAEHTNLLDALNTALNDPSRSPEEQARDKQLFSALRKDPKAAREYLTQLAKADVELRTSKAKIGLKVEEQKRLEEGTRGGRAGVEKAESEATIAKMELPGKVQDIQRAEAIRGGVPVEEEIQAARDKAAVAGRPATLNTQIGDEAVTLQETAPGSGKWEVLTAGGQAARGPKKPLVEIFQGMTPEQAGRFSQFRAGLRDIEQLIPSIFEGGDLDKGKVDRLNLFTSWLNLPFTKGRDINRFMSDAIEAKLRAETGAAAPEPEIERILQRFKPSLKDTDAQIRSKIKNLRDYLQDTVVLTDPLGRTPGGKAAAAPTKPFGQRYKELQKQHPDWTEFELFGRIQAEGYK